MSEQIINRVDQFNQRYLMASLKVLQEQLESYRASITNGHTESIANKGKISEAQNELNQLIENMKGLSSLEILAHVFGLSAFEKNILLLCAGIELDSNFASLIADLQNSSGSFLPSFSLALSTMPDAHWSALSPNSPLRYWRLIELTNPQFISRSPIKIDEHILHFLAGLNQLDEKLSSIIHPMSANSDLVSTHIELSNQVITTLSGNFNNSASPIIQLSGNNKADKESIAVYVSQELGLYSFIVSVNMLPVNTKDIIELARLWSREAALKSYLLVLDYTNFDAGDKSRLHAINVFIENIRGQVIVSSDHPSVEFTRAKVLFEVNKPTPVEQLQLWKQVLSEENKLTEEQLNKLVSQFNLSSSSIYQAGREILVQSKKTGFEEEILIDLAWKTCRVISRPDVGELASRIESQTTMDDLILPEQQKEILKELIVHVNQRSKVYEEWGFGERGSRGLGIAALFSGESGTGKTMAAEVLANTLKLDLYRIDLSQVVNKYIGETEKNLKKIFDAAEDGGAILLFDEADALFGKRSEVRDSHDRYANMEVSYLLQRMEAYRGLAILTTNMKNGMDKAWMRRIRFIVQFPFPDAIQRADIWRGVFPACMPKEYLEIEKLARLNLAGGNIRNIALNASFIAAGEGKLVNMTYLTKAVRREYNKLEKPLTNSENLL